MTITAGSYRPKAGEVIQYRKMTGGYNIRRLQLPVPEVIRYRKMAGDYNEQANYNYNKHNPAIYIPPPGAAVHMYIYYIEEERHLPQKLLI